MNHDSYVWYASYGSNLNEDRFLCYIRGGQPMGSTVTEPGCRNHTLPVESCSILIPYPLCFSGETPRWGGGRAYIGHHKMENSPTYGRMYQITAEQFMDVVSQENQGFDVNVDLQQIQDLGRQCICDSFYGTIVCLGSEKGMPIFTFTSNEEIPDHDLSAPSEAYLGTIIAGLLDTYSFENKEIVDYLIDKPRVWDKWTRESLTDLIEMKRSMMK
jgi:hypothetical protein